jgi:site-specific DNA recombinase
VKVAVYARYSSDNQREASIADQIRTCRLFAERQGWSVVEEFSDHAMSGATLLRPGFQRLMREALAQRFDAVLAESLDRFSRDQEDTAGLFKRLTFKNVRIITLAEGEITHLHVGLKGTMNALFLKDLADKTRRGLRGRVESGRSGGGLCYGYRVTRMVENGELSKGQREIIADEAAVVCRIFTEYEQGVSPKEIAKRLNKEGVAGPNGCPWSPSTIHGHAARGTGILNNELYVGRLVWNRQRYVKDPDTGKRLGRPNPLSEWITTDVPTLRILDDDLWNRVKARQRAVRHVSRATRGEEFNRFRRPKYLFSGLTKCAVCGGGYVILWGEKLACFNSRSRGTSTNRLTITRSEIEERVLNAVRDKLMRKDLFEEFCEEFTREMNRLRMERRAGAAKVERELAKVDRELRRLVQAIKDGVPGLTLKDEFAVLEGRKADLQRRLAEPEAPPLLHPSMSDLYREKVTGLCRVLEGDEASQAGARERIRGLIDEISLEPQEDRLGIVLKGNLAGMLRLAQDNKRPSETDGLLDQIQLVAGGGFEPPTFGL